MMTINTATNNFEQKHMLFLENCDQAKIPDDNSYRAFSIMLIEEAYQYFFNSLKPKKHDRLSLDLEIKIRFLPWRMLVI